MNKKGMVLISTVIFATVIALAGISYFWMGNTEGDLTYGNYLAAQALHCAEAGIEYAVFRLDDRPEQWVEADWGQIDVPNFGQAAVQIEAAGADWTITSTGIVGAVRRTVVVATHMGDAREISLATINGPVRLTGNLLIDGRNHDAAGNLTQNGDGTSDATGTFAVSIPETMPIEDVISQSAANDVGGTVNHVDYVPANPIYEELITKTSKIFTSPHEVLDPKEKIFHSEAEFVQHIKNLEAEGIGRYIYKPDNGAVLDDLTGITYIDFTGGFKGNQPMQWNDPTLSGEGIVIIHSEDGNGITVNALNENSNFKGIFIVDNIQRIHGSLLGCMFVFNKEKNDLGNGEGQILYSRQIVRQWLGDSAIELPPMPKPIIESWQAGL